MELSVGELAQVLGQSQPRVSRHIKLLADAGIVERRKEGSWVFLVLARGGRIEPLLELVERSADEASGHWFRADHARLAAVRAERAEEAALYFAGQAERWDEIRSLHVAESEVEDAVGRALGGAPIGRLVDIGTGTGRMIELFGPRADSAIGIDRSIEMLRLARAKLDAARIANASVRQGDLYALPLTEASADTVILHQVLHYAQAPAAAIAEAARLRRRDAHVGLGFGDQAMLGWFTAAGLDGDLVEHLAGGELTVTLWRGRKPAAQSSVRVAA